MANRFTLETALRHFGKTQAELLDYKVYEDRVVLVVRPGPKLVYDAEEIARRGRPVEAQVVSSKPVSEEAVKATEAARKMAAQLGIDLGTVETTGAGGKVSLKDVERAAKEKAPRQVSE